MQILKKEKNKTVKGLLPNNGEILATEGRKYDSELTFAPDANWCGGKC